MHSLKVLFTTFTIIFLVCLIEQFIGQTSSIPNDVGEFSYAIIVIYMVFSVIYSLIFTCIDSIFSSNIKIAIYWNIIFAIILIIHGYLYYNTGIDWLSVNTGIKSLTLYESIIKGHYTLPILFIGFLTSYSLYRTYLKNHKSENSLNYPC